MCPLPPASLDALALLPLSALPADGELSPLYLRREVCWSVLECVGVCWSVVQCGAVCCSVVQCVAVCCSVLQCVAVLAVCCSVLQCVAVYCHVLQCVAVMNMIESCIYIHVCSA